MLLKGTLAVDWLDKKKIWVFRFCFVLLIFLKVGSKSGSLNFFNLNTQDGKIIVQ